MAASIGDVKITIGADASGVGPAMRQAQKDFGQLKSSVGGGLGNVQVIAQQATFAIDDFFAAFSTGGVAGGIRGAANNLTAIASMLGGFKVQLLAIAAVTSAGFLAKYFSTASKAIGEASEALARFQEQLKRHSSGPARETSLQEKLRGITGEMSTSGAFGTAEAGKLKLSDLRAEIDAERKHVSDLLQIQASVVGDEETKKVKEQIEATKTRIRDLAEEIREQERLNAASERQLQILREFAKERSRVFGGLSGAGLGASVGRNAKVSDIDAQIAELRQSMVHSFGIAELFNRFPQANAMGSSGAVSTLNAAQFGPQNMQNTLVREAQETNRVLKRIEELEKKKASLEVVPIP